MFFQQGDVLIKKVASIPKNTQKINPKNGRYILAEGEATGHTHAICDTEKVEMFEKDGRLWVGIKEEVEIKHEEHGKIKLPPGDFEISKVKEYDHFSEEAKEVLD